MIWGHGFVVTTENLLHQMFGIREGIPVLYKSVISRILSGIFKLIFLHQTNVYVLGKFKRKIKKGIVRLEHQRQKDSRKG